MSQVFHDIEKKIIKTLQTRKKLTPEEIESLTGLSADQVRRGIEWLRLKNYITVKESKKTFLRLGKNGIDAYENKLPERKLLDQVKTQAKTINELKEWLGDLFGPAMGNAKKNNWVQTEDGMVSIKNYPERLPAEKILAEIGRAEIPQDHIFDNDALASLKKRPDFVIEKIEKQKEISLSQSGMQIELSSVTSGAIDVEADPPPLFAARTHPLKDTIEEIQEAFVSLGFTEVFGNLSQSSFWNFDALFTPQDHPAREMQDTFYLDGLEAKKIGSQKQIQNVSNSHKKNWRYHWDIQKAKKMVLRTHTTCVTIKYLADHKPDCARVFSMGRVFRNEKLSYKHLVEFNQVEGIIVGKNATLRDLMGIQKEFYKRIGLTKIKFWPTFFPYTEPSLQTMVYNEKLGKWVELFGMGIFRPEVTKPLGIDKPVLAWGGGIERIAMLKYDVEDVREFYNNNLGWLRSVPKCQL